MVSHNLLIESTTQYEELALILYLNMIIINYMYFSGFAGQPGPTGHDEMYDNVSSLTM